MHLMGFVRKYRLLLFVAFPVILGTTSARADMAWYPEIYLPNDTTVLTCNNDSICYDVTAFDPDSNDVVSILLLEGPIVFDSIGGHPPVTAHVCFMPDTVGSYRFIWEVRDLWGKFVIDTVTFTVDYGTSPVLSDQSFSAALCNPGESRTLSLDFDSSQAGSVSWESISGPGNINPLTGQLTYIPDSAGSYTWLVAVTNWCGTDTTLIADQISLNSPPIVTADDQVINLCAPEQICFDVFGSDPDGDSIEIRMIQGSATFNMNSDTSGTACFDPVAVDSADYYFVFRAADSCGSFEVDPGNCLCVDTVKITVLMNRAPSLVCPDTIKIPACYGTDPYCFDVSASDLDGDLLTYQILSDNATVNGSTICVDALTAGTFTVTVAVSDSCGSSDTCNVPVEVATNAPPVATLGNDFDIFLCAPEQVCLSGSVLDPDGNVASSSVNIGQFDSNAGTVCFTPDTAGIYGIILTAVDSCGAVDSDTAYVTVQLNQLPAVVLPDDFSFDICGSREICFPVTVTDDNLQFVSSNVGAYIANSGEVCFTADTAGVYTVIVQAGDGCSQTAADTLVVTVTEQPTPTVSLGSDTSLSLCQTQPICIDYTIDGAYQSIAANMGTIDEANSQLCFTPEAGGNYTLILSVQDNCGVTVADTVNISVDLGNAPVIAELRDTTVYLCYPQYVCIPFTVYDMDGDIMSITTSTGYIQDGEICFQGRKVGFTDVILTVTDSCGNTAVDTARIDIRTDQMVQLNLPTDTVIFNCQPETLCFPAGQIPVDAQVDVSGINTWYDAASGNVCFYTDCGTTNHIVMNVTTVCGVYADSFTVTSICNSDPLVILPPDTAIQTCEIAEICLPVGISDVDNNVSTVNVIGATYDPTFHEICFTPDTSGTYTISVTATDECGATGTDQMIIAVYANQPPVCNIPQDTTIWLCAPDTIRLPVTASDFDGNLAYCEVTAGEGVIQGGEWIFVPQSAGTYNVNVRCVDNCGAECNGSFTVTVGMNTAPICESDIDTSVTLCQPEPICLPVGASDPEEGQILSEVYDGPGTISEGFWCYTPTADTSITVTIRHTDDCGSYCDQSITLTVDIANEGYVLECPGDTNLFVCDLSEICLPGFSAPVGANIVAVDPIGGTLSGDTICFVPAEGDNRIGYRVTDNCGNVDSCITIVNVTPNSPPVCVVPNDTAIGVCLPATICLPVSATDVDGNLLNCSIVSGPGNLADGSWCYSPTANDTVTVTVECTDDCGATCQSSFTVTVEAGLGPIAADSSYYHLFCSAPSERQINVIASDPNGGLISYALLAGPGTIDNFGVITYTPDTAGTYTFDVEVANSCGADTVTITDMIDINQPPYVSGFDTTIYLCSPEQICFDINGGDPDGDSVTIVQTDGPGQFVQDQSGHGTTCFTPDSMAVAQYTFVYCVADDCTERTPSWFNACDTVTVTVIINNAPQIVCPDPVSASICGPDTICFPLNISDPDGDQLTTTILSGNAYVDGSNVCVPAASDLSVDVIIEVTDECGAADTCTVPVNVTANQPPIVITGPDTALTHCGSQEICISASVTDPEGVLFTAYTDLGVLDLNAGRVCFIADTSGVYEVVVNATDSCGQFASDTTLVTVNVFGPPSVTTPDDFVSTICADSLVCFGPVTVTNDAPLTLVNYPQQYDAETGEICFTADTAGVYSFVVSVEDSCGHTAADTTLVTVIGHTNPTLSLGSDQILDLCAPEEVCVDVVTSSDIFDIETSFGIYNPETRRICFTPETAGDYTIAAQLTDTYWFSVYYTVNFAITINSAPVVVDFPDKDFYLCYPQYVCVPVTASDVDGNIASITANRGYYQDGNICFLPRSYGQYEIIVTVTDSCGAVDVDTALVNVQTDQAIEIGVPNDTSIFLCEPDTLCFPVTGIPDWADVTLNGINTWYDAQSQTICYFTTCGTTNHISISATTECGTYSASFTVVSICDSRPLVILPPDESLTLCGPDTVCVPVAVSDPDDNLLSVQVTGGVYDPTFGQVCFYAASPGSDTITVTATDSCGKTDSDEIIVDVQFNSNPQITSYPVDSSITVCQLDSVCLPFDYVDAEGNIRSVTSSFGIVNQDLRQICFLPDTSGVYCIQLKVTDSCGLSDMVNFCVTIQQLPSAYVSCSDTSVFSCGATDICVPVQITGTYNTISTSLGQYSEGFVCFNADTSGIYELVVITDADCNVDTCTSSIDVTIGTSVDLGCPSDTSVFLCGPDTLDFDLQLTGTYDSIRVSAPAILNGSIVRLPITSSGKITVSLKAYTTCGIDSCRFAVTTTMNSKPSINAGQDFETVTCSLDEICFPISTFDVDGNIDTILSSIGTMLDDSTVCFTPGTFGLNRVIVTLVDDCGATDKDTIDITVTHGGNAIVNCPLDMQYATVCGPGYYCTPISFIPETATITVLPEGYYDAETGEICVYIDAEGVTTATVIADALCGSDTCSFSINTTFTDPVSIACPNPMAIMVCVDSTDSLCIPLDVTGAGVSVNVNPFGIYSGGEVCFPVDSAGAYELEIIAYSNCNADTCIAQINILDDQAPSLTVPADTTIYRCPQDTGTICIDGIFASDSHDTVSIAKVCGAGVFNNLGIGVGEICFQPDTMGVYEFCIEASDGCKTTTKSFNVTVEQRADCDVCLRVSIDGGSCIPVGIVQNVNVNVQSLTQIGGFELLIGYDASVMTFRSAVISGGAIDGWEYFTYRLLDNGSCGGSCPGGMVRLVGIADANNGTLHPPAETLQPNGRLVRMQFQIANNQNLGDQFLPIRFFWFDCSDNTFSSVSGNDLYMDSRIRNAEGLIIWDEAIDQIYPESARQFGLGAPDSCVQGDKPTTPIRCVEFTNGGICIIHPDSIDARGDINLNDVPYEIADAVLFSNYFIYGLSVFTKNPAGQTAASDVNADGLTLTVADLVQLIRVIVGDASPLVKPVVPYEDQLILTDDHNDGTMTISSDAVSTIGAAHLVYNIEGKLNITSVSPGSEVGQMMLGYNVVDGQLRMLIYDIGDHYLHSGRNQLAKITYTGGGRLILASSDIVDYQARPYDVVHKDLNLPTAFNLRQNYPNPFNPATTIAFSLPKRSEWSIEIYNITGKLVRRFDGNNEAGEVAIRWDGTSNSGNVVASGIYLYRLTAPEFTDTKKMVLLK